MPVWCPFQSGDMRAVEKVQRKATKIVPALKNISLTIIVLYSNEFACPVFCTADEEWISVIMVYLIVR